jgi:exosortase
MSKQPQNEMDDSAGWSRTLREPAVLALLFAIVATLVYFFGFERLFTNGRLSTAVWAWQAWTPETNYEHAKLIPLIVAFLVWHDRDKLKRATVGSSGWGWLVLGFGLFLFVAGARTLQARLSLTALPFVLFGLVLYVWGRAVARVLLFPIAFLLFMVPLNFLTQATVPLQFFETRVASGICNVIGIHINSLGSVMTAADNSFRFQVDEGCSGIRSLMAIAMISAIYGHLTQDRLWKKLVIFSAAIVFAIIGNAGRLVSIVLVARCFGQDLAGGPYHAMSGYLSFPFALGAMVLFGRLINLKPAGIRQAAMKEETVSYDY